MASGPTSSVILTFLGQEARGLRKAFWGLFWKLTLIVTFLVVVSGLVGSREASGASAQNDSSLSTQIVAYLVVGLYFGAILGAVVGLFAALWRLFGPSLLAVLVVAPALMVLVLWLFHGPIASSAVDFLYSVAASAQREGLQQTAKAAEGMRLSCGGGGIAVLFLVLLSPFLLADIGLILADANVLWAFLKFAGTMALTLLAVTSAAFLSPAPSWCTLLSDAGGNGSDNCQHLPRDAAGPVGTGSLRGVNSIGAITSGMAPWLDLRNLPAAMIQMKSMPVYSHSSLRTDGTGKLLHEHLREVADRAKLYVSAFNAGPKTEWAAS